MTTIASARVRTALSRVRDQLGAAAGRDKRLARADVALALSTLPPTEKDAVEAVAAALFAREKKHGVVTVADIDRAMRGAQRRLAPKTRAELDVDDVRAAMKIGAAIVELAQRLAGMPGAQLPPPIPAELLKGKGGDELLAIVRAWCLPHVNLGYGTARDVMYGFVDAENGAVRDVYTGRTAPIASRMDLARLSSINAEHTYPQSQGVDGTPALADLHHLFPADALANGKRSSFPFGDVVTVEWEQNGAKLGLDAAGVRVFEVPDAHKGDTARALFYVSALYELPIDDLEEKAMRRWNRRDPVDADERARNDRIASVQENRNPFVDDPRLVGRVDDF